MNVSCTNCPAKYAVPDEKVRGRKVRITCKRCGAAIIVDGTGGVGDGDSAQQRPQSIQAQSVAPSAQPPAAAAAAAQSGARSMAKRTMMGVAPPAFGSSAPPPPAPSPPPAAAPAAQRPPVDARKSTMVGGLGAPLEPPPEQQQARREPKRTMVGGLEAPALAAAARAATSGGGRPVVVVPRAAPEPETKWTVAVTDEQHEEMTVAEAVELYAAGTINEETFIWKEGMPDWQMPFELPEFAKALKARGFAPGQPVRRSRELEQYHLATGAAAQLPLDSDAEATRIAPFGAPESSSGAPGVWREPGLVGPNREVSFDDVTVAMQAPQAEELLREAGLDGDDDEQRPFNAEAQPLSEPMFPVSAHKTPPAPPPEALLATQAAGRRDFAPPQPFGFKAPSAGVAEAQPQAAAARDRPRSAARRDSAEPAQDMFGEAARAEHGGHDEADSAGAQQHQKLTGQRNESSVLFSLDALIKADGGAPPEPEKPKRRDEEAILLGSNPQGPKPAPAVAARDNAPPDSLVNVGGGAMFGSATLAAPDVTAPAPPPSIKKPRPKPESKPGAAPPSSAVAAVETTAPRRSGLWIGLIALFFALVGGGGYLYMKRPELVARMIGRPPPEPTATTLGNTAETPPTAPPTATEAPTQSATPAASASGAAAPSAAAATEQRRADDRRRDDKKEEKAKPAEKPAPSAAPAESAPAAPAAGSDFDRAAASSALATAAGSASSCKQPDGPTGSGKVMVTFAPTGRATNAVVTGDFAGTSVGGCVARIFRNARVPPFSGEPITVARSFTIN